MNGSTPGLVTIVTPTLNAARFLKSTIESVLAQSYSSIEYFVVDGGSRDETLDIATAYGPRVVILERRHSTQAEAIREGFRRANGEYFAFLNADDVIEPSDIAVLVGALRSDPAAPFAYSDAEFIDEDGRTIGRYPTGDFDFAALAESCFICQPATLIRAAAYRTVGGIDARYQAAFDYDLWFRLARLDPPVRVPGVYAGARMHTGSKTHRLRRANFREIVTLLQHNNGYVPFSWVHAYAGILVTGKDLFFDPPQGSLKRTALTLWLGLAFNPRRWARFIAEYVREIYRLRRGAHD